MSACGGQASGSTLEFLGLTCPVCDHYVVVVPSDVRAVSRHVVRPIGADLADSSDSPVDPQGDICRLLASSASSVDLPPVTPLVEVSSASSAVSLGPIAKPHILGEGPTLRGGARTYRRRMPIRRRRGRLGRRRVAPVERPQRLIVSRRYLRPEICRVTYVDVLTSIIKVETAFTTDLDVPVVGVLPEGYVDTSQYGWAVGGVSPRNAGYSYYYETSGIPVFQLLKNAWANAPDYPDMVAKVQEYEEVCCLGVTTSLRFVYAADATGVAGGMAFPAIATTQKSMSRPTVYQYWPPRGADLGTFIGSTARNVDQIYEFVQRNGRRVPVLGRAPHDLRCVIKGPPPSMYMDQSCINGQPGVITGSLLSGRSASTPYGPLWFGTDEILAAANPDVTGLSFSTPFYFIRYPRELMVTSVSAPVNTSTAPPFNVPPTSFVSSTAVPGRALQWGSVPMIVQRRRTITFAYRSKKVTDLDPVYPSSTPGRAVDMSVSTLA